MLSNETLRKLRKMHLGVMAETFSAQLKDPQFQTVSFETTLLCWWMLSEAPGKATGSPVSSATSATRTLPPVWRTSCTCRNESWIGSNFSVWSPALISLRPILC